MKIAFGAIAETKLRYSLPDNGWFPHDEVAVASPAAADLVLQRKSDDTVALNGRLVVTIRLECSRCGDTVEYVVDEDFSYLVTTREEEHDPLREVECSDEECTMLYLLEPVIDLGEILREQVFLALPAKVLCSEECRGLCPRCGAVLNRGACSCDNTNQDSPFAVLKAFKKHNR